MKVKKILSMTLALIMTTAILASCGKSDDSSKATEATTAATTTEAPTTSEPDNTPTELVDEDPFKDSEKEELNDQYVAAEMEYAANIGVSEGEWLVGSDSKPMENGIMLEDFDNYEALQIFYTSDFSHPDINVTVAFKGVMDDADPANITKQEFLPPAWVQYGPADRTVDATTVHKQPLATTGVITLKMEDIKNAINADVKYINQIGFGLEALDTETAEAYFEETGTSDFLVKFDGVYLVKK